MTKGPSATPRNILAALTSLLAFAVALVSILASPTAAAVVEEGIEPVSVYVFDTYSSEPLAGVRVNAWRYFEKNGALKKKRVGRADTDESGKVVFSINFTPGKIQFTTSPYPGEVRSESFDSNPEAVELLVGSTPVTVMDCELETPYTNRQVTAFQNDIEKRWGRVRTDENGIARFDPPFGKDNSFVFQVKDPGGSGVILKTDPIMEPGPVTLCTDESDSDVTVTVRNAQTEDPLPGVRVKAWRYVEKDGVLKKKRVGKGDTDESGNVTLRVNFAAGAVHFSASPYPGEVKSESYDSNPETVELLAGTTPVAVKNCADDTPYADVKVVAFQTGATKRWARRHTDEGGVAYFDPPFGNDQSYTFQIKDPLGSREILKTDPVLGPGPVTICVGNDEVDNTPPEVSISSPSDGAQLPETGFAISGTASDNVAISDIVISYGGMEVTASYDTESGLWMANLNPPLSLGDLTITATAIDTSGNEASDAVTVEIQEAEEESVEIRHLINRITYGVTPDQLYQLPLVDTDSFRNDQLEKTGVLNCIDPLDAQNPATSLFTDQLSLGDGIGDNRELANYAALMAVFNECQLREVLTQFWDNHFSTYYYSVRSKSGAGDFQTTQWELAENDAFRQNALGNFRDLLAISSRSPAMLWYLDGVDNLAGNPNENYSRELQELHTLSVDGGYTAADVNEIARAFTGWTVDGTTQQFICDDATHDFGAIEVDLGQPLQTLSERVAAPENCEVAGDWVLDRLAGHPSTHEFICEKLTQLLVNDDPPDPIVASCATVFGANLNHPDQIALAVEQILTSPEFVNAEDYLDKVKTPLELAVGFMRNFSITGVGLRDMAPELEQMSMRLFGRSPPDGYPEVAPDWINSELNLQRFRFVNEIAFDTNTNDIYIDPIDFFSVQNGQNTDTEIVDFLLDLVLANEHTNTERDVALAVLNTDSPFDINAPDAAQKLRRLLAIMLNSPGYQYQ